VPEAKRTSQQKGRSAQIIASHSVLTFGEIITEAERQGLRKIAISALYQSLKVVHVAMKRVHVIHAMRNVRWELQFLSPYSPKLKSLEGCIADPRQVIQAEFAITLWMPLLNLSVLLGGTWTGQRE
jgi:hypothetical protein